MIAATHRQQEPFVYGSLSKEPIFLKSPPSPEQAIPLPAAAPAPTPDEIAWGIVKESKEITALKRFVENFPDSRLREEAEKRMRALAAVAPAGNPAEHPSKLGLVRQIKTELARVGCYAGPIDDQWNSVETRSSLRQFATLERLAATPDEPAMELLATLRARRQRVCPPTVQTRPSAQRRTKHQDRGATPRRETGRRAPREAMRAVSAAPTGNPTYDPHDRRRRVTGGGLVTCGPRGCQTVPKGCYAVRGGGGGGMGGRVICP